MSLWGSKKQNSDQQGQAEDDHDTGNGGPPQDFPREPTERDSLLGRRNPRPPHADGYLDPDDPAVSPYNLWTVRFLRYVTFLFLVITFIWWVLLLVSIFVSPPGLHTRGSGFFDFAYTTLAAALLVGSLLFMSAPGLVIRVCQGIVAVLLLVDLIIIVSVPRLRGEEGPPGIASVVWATVLALWCVMVDRVVTWGKREEEERLTGRPETRRTVQEWLSVLVFTVLLIVLIAVSVLMTATLIIRARDASLEWDGERYSVDDGKYKVHLSCYGENTVDKDGKRSPTILLEGGEDPVEYSFESWVYSSVENGTIDRYCYWDRPGYAWSDNAPSPHSAGMSADNLAEALAIAGEEGPWILVSTGYGSIVSRIFSAFQRHDVVGMLLVDPLHEDLLTRIASPSRGFVLWGWGVLSPIGIQRIIGSLFFSQSREDRVYGSAAHLTGKFIKAQLQENLVATSISKAEARTARTIQVEDTPLVVVSSGINVRKDAEWADKQRDLTNITGSLLAWDVVNKAPHTVWDTLAGRSILEKRLGQLVQASKKVQLNRALVEFDQ